MQSIADMIRSNKKDILQKYESGESINSIANRLNINSGNLYLIMKEWNVLKLERKDQRRLIDYEDEVRRMYKENYSCYKIGKELKFSTGCVIKYMNSIGLDASRKSKQRKDPLKNHKEEIIRLYTEDHLSANQIALKYEAATGHILKILNDVNIDTSKVLISVNEKYFEKLDSKDKCWQYGLYLTDGNNTGRSIRLQMTDLDIIEKCKKHIKYEGKLYITPPRSENYKTQYCLTINRPCMSEQLTNLGCPPNKTFTTTYPSYKIVPEQFTTDFIRGLLDGDGSITKTYVNWTGTLDLLKGIEAEIYKNLGIFCHTYERYKDRGPEYNIRSLMICKREDNIKLCKWLYKDSTEDIRGNRKYENAVKFYFS